MPSSSRRNATTSRNGKGAGTESGVVRECQANDNGKKHKYISKLKYIAKLLSPDVKISQSSLSQTNNSSTPQEGSPQRLNGSSSTEKDEQTPEKLREERLKKERQIRSQKKLKELAKKLESESPSRKPSVTWGDIPYVSRQRPETKLEPVKEKKQTFNLYAFMGCCDGIDVEDVFSEDDDIDQLIEPKESEDLIETKESEDTTILDDWSLSTRSKSLSPQKSDGQNKRFFRGDPSEI